MSTVNYNNYEANGISVSPATAHLAEGRPAAAVSGSGPGVTKSQPAAGPQSGASTRPLHRIAEVRQQQSVSTRSVARKLNITSQQVLEREDPQTDLKLSDLLRWQEVLDVPLVDLLVDNAGPLSEPVYNRASMLRIMKTTKAILETAHECSVKRLANMLVGQLVQMMPELAEVSGWHSVGQRRTHDEVGQIAYRTMPDSFFNEVDE